MNLSILKKSIPAVMMAAVCAASLSATAVTASATDNNNDEIATGLLEMPVQEADELRAELFKDSAEDALYVTSSAELPNAVDLSIQPNFPPISNQGGIESCASFATTYYQFSYEAYKNKGIDLKDPANAGLIYSPLFTYNMNNGGQNVGTFMEYYPDVLANQGCLKLEDYPYSMNSSTLNYQWPTDAEKLREALKVRVTNHGYVTAADGSESSIAAIKSLLYGTDGTDGHVLAVGTFFRSWKVKKGENPDTGAKEDVAYGCYGTLTNNGVVYSGGHAMAIVGYNDDIWTDINGNGLREESEYGAFKVANSHGTGSYNNGFVWVAYDALNPVTAVPDRTDFNYRRPLFQWNSSQNIFYWYDVEEVKNYYVGEAIVDTNYRDTMSVWATRSDADYPTGYTYSCKVKNQISNSHAFAFNGPVVFAFDEQSDPIKSHLTGYNYGVDIDGSIVSGSFRILDSKGNVVKDLGSIQTDPVVTPVSLEMGDLNYDGALNPADNVIYDAADFSDLQAVLAEDYDYEAHQDNPGPGPGPGPNPDPFNLPNGEVSCSFAIEGDQVTVTVVNVSDTNVLRNWALRANDFFGTPSQFWGADYIDGVIYSKDYNSVLQPGQSTTFGYKISNWDGTVPAFELVSTTIELSEDDVDVDVQYTGWSANNGMYTITITNTGDEAINGWTISFSADGLSINSAWGAAGNYTVADGVVTINCANHSGFNTIAAGQSVQIYMSVNVSGEVVIDNIVVTATGTLD